MGRISCKECERLNECLDDDVVLRATDEVDDHARYIVGLGRICKKLEDTINKLNADGAPNVMTYKEFCASFPDMEENDD